MRKKTVKASCFQHSHSSRPACNLFFISLVHNLLVWVVDRNLNSSAFTVFTPCSFIIPPLIHTHVFYLAYVPLYSSAYLHLFSLFYSCSLLSIKISLVCNHHRPCILLPELICQPVHYCWKQKGPILNVSVTSANNVPISSSLLQPLTSSLPILFLHLSSLIFFSNQLLKVLLPT